MKPKTERIISNITTTACMGLLGYLRAEVMYSVGDIPPAIHASYVIYPGVVGVMNSDISMTALREERESNPSKRLRYLYFAIPVLGSLAGIGARTLQKIVFGV